MVTLDETQYHTPTWASVQIRMIPLGHWRANDHVPRIAYTRIHQYIEWVLEHHVQTGLSIEVCLLMHPTESVLLFDKSRWCRLPPRPTCPLEAPDQECMHYDLFDDPDGMFGLMRNTPLHVRALITHLGHSGRPIVVSEHAASTIGEIVDMIIIDAAYLMFKHDESDSGEGTSERSLSSIHR